jgi:hypothetical protein
MDLGPASVQSTEEITCRESTDIDIPIMMLWAVRMQTDLLLFPAEIFNPPKAGLLCS